MKIDREMMRGAGPIAVLKLLSTGEMYGYELVQKLASRSDGVLGMQQSTLYPMLYNLEAKGLVVPDWREMSSGRKRKYYHLTDKGREALLNDTKKWRALVEAMTSIGILDTAEGGASA